MSGSNIEGCEGSSEGCFASDPEALAFARSNGDRGIRRNNNAIMVGAIDAAVADVPFKDATYNPVFFSGVGSPRPIREVAEGNVTSGDIRLRMAQCAYACGKRAIDGSCSLGVTLPQQKQ